MKTEEQLITEIYNAEQELKKYPPLKLLDLVKKGEKYDDLIERVRAAFRTFWFSRSVTWHDLSNVKKIESDIFQDELNQP